MVSLTVELPEEESAALAGKARTQGLSVEQYARHVLENDLAPAWLRESWQTAQANGLDQLTPEEIDAEISAARKARHASV